jgi:hypothetical protein
VINASLNVHSFHFYKTSDWNDNVKLTKEFGEFNYKHICEIYHVMIGMVDSKARKLYMVLIVLANGWHLFWTFQG